MTAFSLKASRLKAGDQKAIGKVAGPDKLPPVSSNQGKDMLPRIHLHLIRLGFLRLGFLRLGFLAAILGLPLFGLPSVSLAQSQPREGWTILFDGTSLNHWNAIGNANWTLHEGLVEASQGNGYLVSKQIYADFELRAEIFVDETANSGIFFRGEDPLKVANANAYEANIFDQRPDPTYGTGALVDVAKVDPMPKAGGKWNVLEISAKGHEFSIRLNGQTTVNKAQDTAHAKGVIALQYGKGLVKFRRVEIKPL